MERVCAHLDQPYYSHGLCKKCYLQKNYQLKKKQKEENMQKKIEELKQKKQHMSKEEYRKQKEEMFGIKIRTGFRKEADDKMSIKK